MRLPLLGIAITVFASAAPAQDLDAAPPPVPATVSLLVGQAAVIYETASPDYSLSTLAPAVERRNGAWRPVAADSRRTRAFTSPLGAPAAPPSVAPPVASMELAVSGDGFTVAFPEPSTPLVDADGAAVDALDFIALDAAGWITLPGDPRPTAFVTGSLAGASCCAVTLLARRGDDGRWSWRGHAWGPYFNTPALADLDGDGVVEWLSSDQLYRDRWPSVSGAFGPLGIWQLTPAGFAPVTGRFPAQIEADRRSLWRAAVDFNDLALASWIAETRLLGLPVPHRRVRARAVALSAGDAFNLTPDAWLRSLRAPGDRYVAAHSPRIPPTAGRSRPSAAMLRR